MSLFSAESNLPPTFLKELILVSNGQKQPPCAVTSLVEQGRYHIGGVTETTGSEGMWLVVRLNIVSTRDRKSEPGCGFILCSTSAPLFVTVHNLCTINLILLEMKAF